MTLRVEVIYALPQRTYRRSLELEDGATVGEAIERSKIADDLPDIVIADQRVGVFGKPCSLKQPLRDGDRVEIYRPLLCDPKEVRRQRAAKG